MESLFFRLTADKTLKRNMQLLKLLSINHGSVVSIDEIAQNLSISRETVISDIEILTKRLPVGIQIIREKWVGVTLLCKKEVSIDNYIAAMAKDTVVYKLLDSIFHGRQKNISQWEKELFLSNAALRNRIKYFNRTLKEFRLKFSAYTMELVGEEADIRYFYYVFYKEFRDLFVVRTEDTTYTQIITDLKQAGVLQCSYGYFPATLWLMIAAERIRNEKYVSLHSTFMKRISKRASFSLSVQIQKQVFQQYFQIESIPQNEHVWMYITSLHCVEYIIDPDAPSIFMREEDEDTSFQIDHFLREAIKKFHIDSEKQKDFLYTHHAFWANMHLLTHITPLYQQCSLQVKTYITKTHPTIYYKWLTILKRARETERFPFYFIEDICVMLTMLTISFLPAPPKKVKHILLSFREDAGFSAYLTAMAKTIIPDTIRCTFINDKLIDQKTLEALNVDLFISNYNDHILTKTIRQLELSSIPTMSEWAAVRNYILDLDAIDPEENPYQNFW